MQFCRFLIKSSRAAALSQEVPGEGAEHGAQEEPSRWTWASMVNSSTGWGLWA